MSVKLDLYRDIKAALQDLTFMENVLHYNGQDLLNYEKDNSKRFPQSWIQISNVTWQPSQQIAYNQNRTQQQKSDTSLITVYYASYSLLEDDETFETDLVNIDLIYRALTMLEGDNYSPLQRIGESDIATNNNVRVWAQEYTTMLTEPAIAKTLEDAAPLTLEIITQETKTDNFISTDIPGQDVEPGFVPDGTETIHES
jgi:hypothetical protein